MRIVLDISNSEIADELFGLLAQYRSKGVVIHSEADHRVSYTDEQLEKDWKKIISHGLRNLSDDYYKSDQYKLDRAAYATGKHK